MSLWYNYLRKGDYMTAKDIIKKVFKNHWRLVFSISFVSLISLAARIAMPLFFKNIIKYIEVNDLKFLLIWGSLFILVVIMGFFFTSLNNNIIAKLGNNITEALSEQTYKSYLRSEHLEATRLTNDEIVKRILKNTDQIGNKYYSQHVFVTIYQGLLLLGLTTTLAVINPWFGLVTVATYPLYYLITKHVAKIVIARKAKANDYNQLLRQTVEDTSHRLKSIKFLNSINQEEERFLQLVNEYGKAQRKNEHIKQFDEKSMATFISSLIMVAIVVTGSYLIIQDLQDLGVMLASTLLLTEIYPALRILLSRFLKPSAISVEKSEVDEILALKPENRADTVQQLDEIYSLKYKEVSFDYGPNTKFSLQDISFELKKGEKLGILGLTSSGKTTLSDLLMKIIRPKQGAILINNCDINKVNSYYLRDLIAAIPQSHPIIRGTFAENITYPLPFDEYKYNDALNRCHLKPLLNQLEKRDQTIIDDTSPLLSASDKQKIAIANALYKDAKIYIFDDSTTKMSQDLEKEVIDEIYRLKNKIIILISNRIYNLVKCDKIIILNNGRIVESGKTEELLENTKSTFARLIGEQSLVRPSVNK